MPSTGARLGGVAVSTLALLVGACGSGRRGAATCPAPAGARALVSSGPGRWEEQGVEPRLVELWRAGGLREGETLILPVAASVAPDGRVAIPDFRLGEIFLVGPDGSWRGRWARRGRGPGEMLRPVAATWTPDGTLVVFDVEGGRLVWLRGAMDAVDQPRVDPRFVGPVVASGSLRWSGVAPGGTAYLVPGGDPVPGEARMVTRLVRHRPERGVTDTLFRDTVPTLAAVGRYRATPVPGAPLPGVALGPAGSLYRGDPGGAYRILQLEPAGAPARLLCRAAPPLPYTPHERGEGELPAGQHELARRLEGAPRPERPAAVGRIIVGRRGRLWIQRDRPDPFDPLGRLLGAPGARHDLFGSDGAYLGGVRAPEGVRLQAARGDTVWGFEVGELDETWLVAYELRLETG